MYQPKKFRCFRCAALVNGVWPCWIRKQLRKVYVCRECRDIVALEVAARELRS